ncbi:MAG: Crp/Fnr family transcriptional regulator [Lysobacteraceae bacterium]|nr:MAG: Crp/Fnr family transcriptional regulator [Xanthomonadaceae bacterium]
MQRRSGQVLGLILATPRPTKTSREYVPEPCIRVRPYCVQFAERTDRTIGSSRSCFSTRLDPGICLRLLVAESGRPLALGCGSVLARPRWMRPTQGVQGECFTEFFGELFLDGGRRSASVKAVVDSQCIVVGHDAIRGFMQAYPEFAQCLVHKLIERLRHATQLNKSLGLHGVYERTVDLLNQVAFLDEEVRVVPPSITQQEIADRVGATREMINHVLRDLIRGGFLTRDDRRRLVFAKVLPRRW